MEHTNTIIMGAGQAGLSLSHELTRRRCAHLVLEAQQIGQGWASRWDAFRLVTPNWSVRLPGYPYTGDDPDGFMARDEVVAHLRGYAESFGAPVRESTRVTDVKKAGYGWVVNTTKGTYGCRNLVMANGAYQKPFLPRGAADLPQRLCRMTLADYANPDALPEGRVLVIGSGQSGSQIAEDLAAAGRRVTLACGRVGWAERRIGGKDIVWWGEAAGFYTHTPDMLPPGGRLAGNVLASGHRGGHTINFQVLQDQGIELVGRFEGCTGEVARFADDLEAANQFSNDRYADLCKLIAATAERLGETLPDFAPAAELSGQARTEVNLADYGTVLFTGGFRPDYDSLLQMPHAFDTEGFPIQTDGRSGVVEGLWFMGTHFLRNRGSSLLIGVGEDAKVVAEAISAA